MTRSDFIEKMTNTDMFTASEAVTMADCFDEYEDVCREMYFAAEDVDAFNAIVCDKISRKITPEQLERLCVRMDEEW